jgi:predicted nucleotide-binding protein (sugar kinase/HSP70/actin superfamily)
MSISVGIPRGLLYYKYFPLWQTFLSELGLSTIVSPPTNKRILNLGTSAADNEICLPVKIFYGHVLELKDKVDALFIPRMVSVEKEAYTCPKFLGLPDLIGAVDESLPSILAPIFNAKLGLRQFYRNLFEFGSKFSRSTNRIWQAWRKAVKTQKKFEKDLIKQARGVYEYQGLKIGIAGHPYNVHDKYVSFNLIKRLENQGAKVVTSENISKRIIEKEAKTLSKYLFWSYEKEVVGAVFYWLRQKVVDGVIYLLSFACGPDSLIQVLLENEAKRNNVPLMPLVIDEHSGEAGLVTRIEAFVDMLGRKQAKSA